MNFLEQLVAEWYEYHGYFVKRNVRVGRLPRGGWECELDVVAFNPESKRLVHIETSMDSDSWQRRAERYRKKFEAGKKYIPALFPGVEFSGEVEQIALFGIGSKANHQHLAEGKVMLISELLAEIASELQLRRVERAAVPEQFPLLRTIQFMVRHHAAIFSNKNSPAQNPH